MQRIAVVGPTGSGKTTLAAELAQRLGVPHVELDALHWGPEWAAPDLEVFRDRVAAALAGEGWVVDGNYRKVREIIWARADTLVWLDYPLRLTLWRLLRRTVRRVGKKEVLWNGNRETWCGTLLAKDSLVRLSVQGHRRMREGYPVALQLPEYRHLRVVRLRTPKEARAWLAQVSQVNKEG